GLIAAYHVLHRLSAPRHPPNTLMALDCSHRQSAFVSRGLPIGKSEANALQREKTSFASNASGDPGGQPKGPRLVARRVGREGQTSNQAYGLTACPIPVSPRPALDRMRFLFTMSDIERTEDGRLEDGLSTWSTGPVFLHAKALTRSLAKLMNCIGSSLSDESRSSS